MSKVGIVIRGSTIADGLGSALFEADIAVAGGKIVEVDLVSGQIVYREGKRPAHCPAG